jgi:N-methylhydantoinase A
LRFAIDTGGTFTDLLVEEEEGRLRMFKTSTTPHDPIEGVLEALRLAAANFGLTLPQLLSKGSTLIYGTTHPINAIITGTTARTAFLTTEGHPDILTLREGGRADPFNATLGFPKPYVPRALTWEIRERVLPDGSVLVPFDEGHARGVIHAMLAAGVEAAGVCLLWSVVNPEHELRLAELIAKHAPELAVTLSHQLNPTLREYRRASSACINASLQPMMTAFFRSLDRRLNEAGFAGRVLVVTSQGGVMDAGVVAHSPIHLINSGPSVAPVAGAYFARLDAGVDSAIIADTGGTTYDVSLVRRGATPITRETWIGGPFLGHMTGFPSVDVRSVGAGGGSVAWLDDGGMLRVGPRSAGASPGPACYARGGRDPTVTDAALTLGYIDPEYFLGGAMKLDADASRRVIEANIAVPLGLSIEEAAVAILLVVTENMVGAIVDLTLGQGVDPRNSVLVGGGGAAGLNSVLIARRLEVATLLTPELAPALSAAGALISDLKIEHYAHCHMTTDAFDYDTVNVVLDALAAKARAFLDGAGEDARRREIAFRAEARYAEQVWHIEAPLRVAHFAGPSDLADFVQGFHLAHEANFAIKDTRAAVEIVGLAVSAAAAIRDDRPPRLRGRISGGPPTSRRAYFPGCGGAEAEVRRSPLEPGEEARGPAILESAFTTIVLNPGATALGLPSGGLAITPGKA